MIIVTELMRVRESGKNCVLNFYKKVNLNIVRYIEHSMLLQLLRFFTYSHFLATDFLAPLAEWDLLAPVAFLATLVDFLALLLGVTAFTGEAETAAWVWAGAAATFLAATFLVPTALLVVVFFEILLAPTFLVTCFFAATALAIMIMFRIPMFNRKHQFPQDHKMHSSTRTLKSKFYSSLINFDLAVEAFVHSNWSLEGFEL